MSNTGKISVGVLEVDQATSLPNLRASRGGFGMEGTTPKYWDGTSWSAFSGTGSGVSTWNEMYDSAKSLTIDSTTLTFALTHASNDGFTLTGDIASAGDVIKIQNAGSGKDLSGTSDTWSFSKAGALLATSIAHPTTNTGIAIDANGSGKITLGTTSTGNIELQRNTTMPASKTLTLAGADGSTIFTMTAGDAVLSEGSLSITDSDNAASFALVNATVTTADVATITAAAGTTGHTLRITADAETTGSILYLDNGGASLTTGYFINCNDDGVSDFTVGADGATVITGAVNSSIGLTVTGIQTNENTVVITSSGVTASDKASLLLNPSGAVASGGNILRVAPSGAPNAGAIAVELVGASKVCQMMYIDGDSTAAAVVAINGGGALTDGYAVLHVSSDGNLASGGNTLKVSTAGTPASGAMYAEFDFTGITDTNENVGVKIDATGKKVQALNIIAAPIASSVAYVAAGAALAADKAVLEVVSVPTTNNADAAVLRLEQTHTAGGANILHMVQNDLDKPFIGFETTVGTGNAIQAVAELALTATHYIMVDIEGVGTRYLAVGTVA